MDEALQAAIAAHKGTVTEPAESEETVEPEKTEETEESVAEATGDEPEAEETEQAEPEEPKPEPSVTEEISQWATLQLQNRREREALEADRQALEAERAKATEAAQLLDLLKSDPRAFFEQANVPIDELTKQVLEGKKADPNASRIEKLEAELAAIRERDEKTKEQQQQAELQRMTQASQERLAAWVEPQLDSIPNLLAVAETAPEVESGRVKPIAMIAAAIHDLQVAHHARTGDVLDAGEIMGKLEKQWQVRLERAAAKRAGKTEADAAPASENDDEPPTTIGKRHASRTKPAKGRKTPLTGRERALARLRAAKD